MRFLNAIQDNFQASMCLFITAFVQICSCFFFVVVLECGIVGTAYAEIVQNFVLTILFEIHIRYAREDLGEALRSFSWAQIMDSAGLTEYAVIAWPSMINQAAIWFSQELCFILSVKFSDTQQAAMLILLNITKTTYLVGFSVELTSATLIGRQIGAAKLQEARGFLRVIMGYTAIILIAIFVFLLC